MRLTPGVCPREKHMKGAPLMQALALSENLTHG